MSRMTTPAWSGCNSSVWEATPAVRAEVSCALTVAPGSATASSRPAARAQSGRRSRRVPHGRGGGWSPGATLASAQWLLLLATHARFLDHETGPGIPSARRASRRSRRCPVRRPRRRPGGVDPRAGHPGRARGGPPRRPPRRHRARFCAAGRRQHRRRHPGQRRVLGRGPAWPPARASTPSSGSSGARRDAAFCAVRPPGHHATRDRVDGLLPGQQRGRRRATRWPTGASGCWSSTIDAHHGNGTQDIFWDDPRVLYVSLPPVPAVPGHRRASEDGRRRRAIGTTVNFPLPPGATGDVYRRGHRRRPGPARRALRPRRGCCSRPASTPTAADPITDLGLTAGDYADVTADLLAFAPAGRRLVVPRGRLRPDGAGRVAPRPPSAPWSASAVPPEAPTAGGPGTRSLGQVAAAQHAAPWTAATSWRR